MLILGSRSCRVLPVEPRSNIDPSEFRSAEVGNRTRHLRRPPQSRIVNHDRHAVAREPNVKLDALGAIAHCASERGDRVLRRHCRCSSVTNDQREDGWRAAHYRYRYEVSRVVVADAGSVFLQVSLGALPGESITLSPTPSGAFAASPSSK